MSDLIIKPSGTSANFKVQNPSGTDKIVMNSSGTITTATLGSGADIKAAINASGDAPIYACRAWVNFNGTTGSGTGQSDMTINASGNVSSITDNGTGDYTVNFTTSMPDTNYSTVGMVLNNTYGTASDISFRGIQTHQNSVATGSIRILAKYVNAGSSSQEDEHGCFVAVFR